MVILGDNIYNSTTRLKDAVRSFEVEVQDAIGNFVYSKYCIIENAKQRGMQYCIQQKTGNVKIIPYPSAITKNQGILVVCIPIISYFICCAHIITIIVF